VDGGRGEEEGFEFGVEGLGGGFAAVVAVGMGVKDRVDFWDFVCLDGKRYFKAMAGLTYFLPVFHENGEKWVYENDGAAGVDEDASHAEPGEEGVCAGVEEGGRDGLRCEFWAHFYSFRVCGGKAVRECAERRDLDRVHEAGECVKGEVEFDS